MYHQSILDFVPEQVFDLVLIKGVLIHINPDKLPQVYDLLYQSNGSIFVFLNITIQLRSDSVNIGHEDKLFKRDFVGEMLDRYSNLQLVDYGFNYHRDLHFPQDDTTWFLLKNLKVWKASQPEK
ncbi:MAG: hypothetical protein R3E08_03535 [Thiotrichaceae bacterium]